MSPEKIGHLAKQCFNVALPLQVCRSEAGYYIGTVHPKDGPYSRESEEYFPTLEAAEAALESGNWTQLEYEI
jgi:hypothetical protein